MEVEHTRKNYAHMYVEAFETLRLGRQRRFKVWGNVCCRSERSHKYHLAEPDQRKIERARLEWTIMAAQDRLLKELEIQFFVK